MARSPDDAPGPVISVVTPVYDPAPEVLAVCVESVRRQSYERWELCLVDDASPSATTWDALCAAAAADPRASEWRDAAHNGGIVAASNDALGLASGEVVALLDHDDELHPDALARVAAAYAAADAEGDPIDYLYTDEDLIGLDGRRTNPFFKPDWSPERFRNQMYTCHLSAIRHSVIAEVGGFREGFDGAQDWDLVLRVTEVARRIHHVPEVLYHWRTVPTSVLAGEHVKPYAYESAARALAQHCARVGIHATVEESVHRGHFRIRRTLAAKPSVSIVIPTRGGSGRVRGATVTMLLEALRSIVSTTRYSPLEVVLVADADTPARVLDVCRDLVGDRLVIVGYDRPFDFADKCNHGVLAASGEVVILLNDDVEVITADWIETLVGFLEEPDVGAVGAHLFFEDGRLQHGGHVLLGGNPSHLMFGRSVEDTANRRVLLLDREVAGVTAACLAIRREVFDEVGGFSSRFPNNYNDVDLCLKIRSRGYRIIVSPHARLYHFESMTRDALVADAEVVALRARWGPMLWEDPYYSPSYGTFSDGMPDPFTYP